MDQDEQIRQYDLDLKNRKGYVPMLPEGYISLPVNTVLIEGDLYFGALTLQWELATGSWAKPGCYYARLSRLQDEEYINEH